MVYLTRQCAMQKALQKVDALAQLRTRLKLAAWQGRKDCLQAQLA